MMFDQFMRRSPHGGESRIATLPTTDRLSASPGITENASAHIPIDRRLALKSNLELPEYQNGSALFADISGFTPLTEQLTNEHGPRRGAEILTSYLDEIYDALIKVLHSYRGSVIGFSGDAISCWLPEDNGHRAAACALKMQTAIAQIGSLAITKDKSVSLAMKTAVAVGQSRRFVVGDPDVQLMDLIVGSVLDELARAEKQAEKGDVVLAPSAVNQLQKIVHIREWRKSEDLNEKFGVLGSIKPLDPYPWPISTDEDFSIEQARPWLIPAVYERLNSGQGAFLAELRPCAALFLRFVGIDYEQDVDAGVKLDNFVRACQQVISRYEGTLLHVTIGDKGSYLYASFGAPTAHEDDIVRAAAAALDLREASSQLNFLEPIQIGITAGRMRAGAYGGANRRTYGVLGDVVNLSARLMQKAEPGQILATEIVQQNSRGQYEWRALPPTKVKGKSRPIQISELVQQSAQRSTGLTDSSYRLPIVGRQSELAVANALLEQAQSSSGQILALTAEAGMGKSRLISRIIQNASDSGFVVYMGECHSYANKTPYFAWHDVWRTFFRIDSSHSQAEQVAWLTHEVNELDSTLAPRIPLLDSLMGLPIPDNALTKSFDAKLRKTSLESFLVQCLRHRLADERVCIVLDDCHWIDSLSESLLEAIGNAIAELPVLLILAYRPPVSEHEDRMAVTQLNHFTELALSELTPLESKSLIKYKLAQLYEDENSASSETVIDQLVQRAAGNPFYIEELLNYFSTKGIDLRILDKLTDSDLPNSLHSLILSRIDQLTESQKGVIKVASVIGRLFGPSMLWGAYPQLGDYNQIIAELDELDRLDLTPIDTPEPELQYVFKNVVTQEVAYENLPFSTRAMLHEQIASYIETGVAENTDVYVNLLSHHYGRSNNEDKKREYYRRAGEAAQASFANEAAIVYYQRLLPLLNPIEQIPITRNLATVMQLVGEWKTADELFRQALQLSIETQDPHNIAWSHSYLFDHLRKQGNFSDAQTYFEQALKSFQTLGDEVGVAQVLHNAGTLAANQGDYDTAGARFQESLNIRRKLNDQENIANMLNNLGILARFRGELETARDLYEESLSIRQELGNKWAIANSQNNLGLLALRLENHELAREKLQISVSLLREIGDRWALANALNNLANLMREQNDFIAATAMYQESLAINHELGDKSAVSFLFEDLACLAAEQSEIDRALIMFGAAADLRTQINSPLPPGDLEKLKSRLTQHCGSLETPANTGFIEHGGRLGFDQAMRYALQ